ncbi:MAG: hypothetical protein HGA85_02580 [Nanoarchaeota archaeon]|nr:hypothetical protein [Nanoarchaeota archaeon]
MRKLEKKVVLFAATISIILYLAGVLSGLFASDIIQKNIKQDIQKDISFLKDYMDISALDVKNIQLQQFFIENIDESRKCEFEDLYLSNLHSQLSSYWDRLPARLEEHDRTNEPTADYISLKREYIRLSLRMWLIAKKSYSSCNDSRFVPVLYFYSKECENCTAQGEHLDAFKDFVETQNKTAIVFPIDLNFADDMVVMLKKFYNISYVPSLIIGDTFIDELADIDTLKTEYYSAEKYNLTGP